MSKGTRVVPIRLNAETMSAIQKELDKRLEHHACEPWTVSDFVRAAIAELLRKKVAGRRGPKAKGEGSNG